MFPAVCIDKSNTKDDFLAFSNREYDLILKTIKLAGIENSVEYTLYKGDLEQIKSDFSAVKSKVVILCGLNLCKDVLGLKSSFKLKTSLGTPYKVTWSDKTFLPCYDFQKVLLLGVKKYDEVIEVFRKAKKLCQEGV